jgi:hypothetical protein
MFLNQSNLSNLNHLNVVEEEVVNSVKDVEVVVVQVKMMINGSL